MNTRKLTRQRKQSRIQNGFSENRISRFIAAKDKPVVRKNTVVHSIDWLKEKTDDVSEQVFGHVVVSFTTHSRFHFLRENWMLCAWEERDRNGKSFKSCVQQKTEHKVVKRMTVLTCSKSPFWLLIKTGKLPC